LGGDASFGSNVAVSGVLTAKNGLLSIAGSTFTGPINGNVLNVTTANIDALNVTSGSTFTGPVNGNVVNAVTVNGATVNASNLNVTGGSTFTGGVYGSTINTSSTITSAGIINANAGLNVTYGSTFNGPIYGTTLKRVLMLLLMVSLMVTRVWLCMAVLRL